jgi:hypothetical protein
MQASRALSVAIRRGTSASSCVRVMVDEVGQRAEGLLDVDVLARTMDL